MAAWLTRGGNRIGGLNRFMVLVIGVPALMVGGLLTWIEARSARQDMHAAMMAEARMLAAAFDGNRIARLTGTAADLTSPDYRYLRRQLIRIREANPKYRYLYFFGRREGAHPFFFMGTAEEGTADYSPPGQVYFEDSPTLNTVFATRSPAISPVFTDRWGTWVSALIPVVDTQSDKLLAVFGMDVSATDWRNEILRRAATPAMITCLVILLAGVGSGYLHRRQLAGHIAALDKAEDALRESEALFRLQFELGNIGIAITSPEKGWLRANARLCSMLGYTEAELRQKTWDAMTHPEDLAADLEQFRQMLEGRSDGYEMDKRFFRKDGDLLETHLTVACHRGADRKVDFVIASLQDIGDRIRIEKALHESHERFKAMIQSASDMILIIDSDGKFIYESPSVSRILGHPEGFFLGQSPFTLIHPDDLDLVTREMDMVYRSANSGVPTPFRLQSADGDWLWLEALASNQYANPVLKGIVVTARDVTERKRAEAEKENLNAQLLQAQKMEAVGHLAGGVAHDFNNMLSVVIGHAEIAMIDLDPQSPIGKRIGTIHEAALRSAGLVRQLLAFARCQTIQPRILDLNTTIDGMLSMLRRLIGEDIDLAWFPGAGIGKVRLDPSQIDQILANLMVNARDAIDGVGKITIETDDAILDEAYCSRHAGVQPGRYVRLGVSDSGCGMDPMTRSRIFDPFFTTKAIGKGTGLGLATVFGIVKQNDGHIHVYSEPGRGTTFRIYLPMVDAPVDPVDAGTAVPTVSKGTGTVLMVEDDAAILELGQYILEQSGFSVLIAETPRRAMELAQAHRGKIDLLITDVVMPQMNGRQLVERLAGICPGLKCLFISGYTANVIAHHGVLDAGVHFLQKPFTLNAFAAKVDEALGR